MFTGSTPNGGNGNYTYQWYYTQECPGNPTWGSIYNEPITLPGSNSQNFTVPQSWIDNSPCMQTTFFIRAVIDSDGNSRGSNLLNIFGDDGASYFNPLPDIDGDGVEDSIDNCQFTSNPNQQDSDGDGIGDACDTSQDLVIDPELSRQYSSTSNTNGDLSFAPSADKPTIYRYGGNITFDPLVVRNIGDGDAFGGPYEIKFYISSDTSVSSDDFTRSAWTQSFNPPAAGQTTPTQGTHPNDIDVSLEGSEIGDNLEYGDYYVLIVIEVGEDNNGENFSNNTFWMPMKYTGTNPITGRVAFLDLGNGNTIEIPLPSNGQGLLPDPNSPFEIISDSKQSSLKKGKIESFNLKIYNINIMSTTPVVNQIITIGQMIDVSTLPNGLYAIHVNDKYIKKFVKSNRR